MSSVCPCQYPIIFVDDRYTGEPVTYISIPKEIFEEQEYIENPVFEEVEEEGFDGELHKYMSVLWKDPKGASLKKYNVNNHIVYAGCANVDGQKLMCRKKDLFLVLHPVDEWLENHIVRIDDEQFSKRKHHKR